MLKTIYVFGLAALMAIGLALPGTAHSAMWVGGELGANWIANVNHDVSASAAGLGNASFTAHGVSFDNPNVIGGLTVGYDFVNTGFGAYSWPEWMKYFSFATDFTYNRFAINSQTFYLTDININGTQIGSTFVPLNNSILAGTKIEGYMAAWTFLFMAHYGFFPDSEVPSGRLVPYVGVGPCVLFSGLNAKFLGSQSSTNIALVTEGGVRFMALKNVSLDLAFRYRYATPSYSFETGVLGVPASVNVDANIHSFTALTRVSYHF